MSNVKNDIVIRLVLVGETLFHYVVWSLIDAGFVALTSVAWTNLCTKSGLSDFVIYVVVNSISFLLVVRPTPP